eukprot:2490493-Prymnesium_polylepis.1
MHQPKVRLTQVFRHGRLALPAGRQLACGGGDLRPDGRRAARPARAAAGRAVAHHARCRPARARHLPGAGLWPRRRAAAARRTRSGRDGARAAQALTPTSRGRHGRRRRP